MNARRRKDLKVIIARLGELDRLREEIQEDLEQVMDDEQEAPENMPERLQDSGPGHQMQEYIDARQDVLYELHMFDPEAMGQTLEEITG
jgi:hypothetical protein